MNSSDIDFRSTLRLRRKERNRNLRAKKVGLIGKIDLAKPSDKKTIFVDNDEEVRDSEKNESGSMPECSVSISNEKKNISPDDEDEVEEVKGSTAKVLALEQREKERKSFKEQKLDSTKRRNRKKVAEENCSEEKMDIAFFEQLDMDLDEERKKGNLVAFKQEGRRTTFVAEEDEQIKHTTDHNLEVVVLESKKDYAAKVLEYNIPSKKATFFSRSCLFEDGKPFGKKRKKKAKHSLSRIRQTQKSEGWRRSAKVKRILLAQSSRN